MQRGMAVPVQKQGLPRRLMVRIGVLPLSQMMAKTDESTALPQIDEWWSSIII